MRVHARDAHVAAERDRADGVLRLAAAHARDQRREEQREALHAHPDRLGRAEVARLVEDDQRGEAEEGEHPAHPAPPLPALACAPTSSPATRRASRVGRVQGLEGVHALGREPLERPLDHRGDAHEAEPAGEEGVDGHLVGGVEHAGGRAARLRCLAREPQAREGAEVRRLEGQRGHGGEIEPRDGHVDALRVVQRVGDRDAHVGQAHVRERRAVAQGHERVDDRLGVHDHVDAVVRRAEQPVRLDHLEALVHQRRGVDRDLPAHRPGGMAQGVLDRHRLEIGRRAPAEGAARRRQDERLHRARPLAGEELVQRRVLGVDGDELRAGRLAQRHDELAADDEGFLVGERDVDALGERDDGRAEPRRADDGVQDQVGVGLRHEADEPLRARRAPRRPSTPRSHAPPRVDPTARHAARRARVPGRRAPRASARPTGRRSRRRRPPAPPRRAPGCRSSPSSRG